MTRYREPRFEHDYVPPRYGAPVPTQSWWKAMPWVVRAAIVVTALFSLLPLLLLMLGGTALGVLLWVGALV